MEIQVSELGESEREESVRMVSESAQGILGGDRRRARALRFGASRFDAAKWVEMAEMGWLMLRIPVERDGLGMGLSELCAIARAMGAELSPEPLPLAALIAPALPNAELKALLTCEKVFLPAFAPFGAEEAILSQGRLAGSTEAVPMASFAAGFLVQTREGAALVMADASGLSVNFQETHDGGHIARLTLAEVPAKPVPVAMNRLRDEAALVLSAQLLGMAETAFDITLTYLKDRRQFGVPIGSFQSLQHRMVDLYLELSLTRAMVESAAECIDNGCADSLAALQASLAKARATRASREITRAAIQLHGGIGYTDEADIGLYLRKVMAFSGLLGSEKFHRDRALALGEPQE